jgi:hypothetical protein
MKRILLIFIPFFCLNLFLVSCNQANNQNTSTITPTENVSNPAENSQETKDSSEKIKFKLENGNEAFSLKPKEDGAKLESAQGKEIARLNLDENGKIKIKDANDKVLGYIVTKSGYWKIENSEQTSELFILRRQDDGDYKLETGDDKEVYRIKKRDYGFEIETSSKQSLYKIKEKEGKISLRNSSDQTILSTKDQFLPIALSCFGFDVLSQPQQAGLAYAVQLSKGQ